MKKRTLIKKTKHYIKYIFAKSLYLILENISIETASNIGSALGKIAYLLSYRSKKIARTNLRIAFPKISERESNFIIKKMFDNLYRTFCETPSVYKLSDSELSSRVTTNHSKSFKAFQDKPIICISGHLGNWDISVRCLRLLKRNISVIYKVLHSPKIDKLYLSSRLSFYNNIPQSTIGLKKVFKAITNKDGVCFLTDQKVNTGMPLKFFGKTAMTASAPMKLALKFDLPIWFGYASRIKGARFETHFEGPYTVKDLLKNKENVSNKELALTEIMNEKIENWIKKDPSQWIWTYKRWDKSFYE